MGNNVSCSRTIDVNEFTRILKAHGGQFSEQVANNPKLIQATIDVMKAAGEAFEDPIGLIGDSSSLVDEVTSKTNSDKNVKQAVKGVSVVLNEGKLVANLGKVNKLTSTSGILIFVGATVVQKTGLALSLSGDNEEKAKCYGALLELGGNAAVTTVTGLGTGPMALLTLASLTAATIGAYNECKVVL